jgi:preprotein translocase subunit SecF
MKFTEMYSKHYKKLFIIPVIMVLIACFLIGFNYYKTGDFINKDVTLKGGITATIYTGNAFPDLKSHLGSKFSQSDIEVRNLIEFGSEKNIGIVIEITDVKDSELKTVLEKYTSLKLDRENYSVEEVGSSLGESFYRQMIRAIIIAFIFMAIVVFITFRAFIPSVAVVFAALSDIVVTVAIINLMGMKLSTAGIAALLMLIGYSIDTDILLTTKILKRKGEGAVMERLVSGMKTGLTMTATTFVALSVGYFVSTNLVLKQMFLIILIGLIVDVISTYMMNAGLLVWYSKRKQ